MESILMQKYYIVPAQQDGRCQPYKYAATIAIKKV
jgi:hypothetical protein